MREKMKNTLLAVENLQTHFVTSSGVVKAVDGVSFALAKGGRLGIVGESGSGKSVTALSILKLVAPPGRVVGGKVLLDGVDLLALSEEEIRKIRGGRIAMVFQEPSTSLNPVFTIGAQIEEVIALHQPALGRKERTETAVESLRRVQIPDPVRVARSFPHELSGGMKQRAMIAMALSGRPEILIADEPTTALDLTVQAQVLDLLVRLQEELGMSLILITHDIGIIAEMVESVVVMKGGKVVESASVRELFQSPRDPYTRHLLEIYGRFAEG